jgi:hypothetical protein
LESPRRQSHETRRLSREATSRHTYAPRRPVGSISARGAGTSGLRQLAISMRSSSSSKGSKPLPTSDRNDGRLQIGTGGRLQFGMDGRLHPKPALYGRPIPSEYKKLMWSICQTFATSALTAGSSWRQASPTDQESTAGGQRGRDGPADPRAAEAALAAWGLSVCLACHCSCERQCSPFGYKRHLSVVLWMYPMNSSPGDTSRTSPAYADGVPSVSHCCRPPSVA